MKRTMVSNKIWRTIVVAGAMLATPLAACGGGDKKADTTPTPPAETQTQADDPDSHGITQESADAQAKFEAEQEAKAKADEEAKAAEEQAAAEAQAKKEADEKAAADLAAQEAAKKPRPRVQKSRPSGRGFILS